MSLRHPETEDERFMKEAYRQALRAYRLGETPIGCVIVKDGEVIARGYNRRNIEKSVTAHAEMRAVKRAEKKLKDWRLQGCTLYVTLEPCPMCAGTLVQSRIDRVVIGCMNPKAGSAGSIVNLLQEPRFNHRAEVTEGILREPCSLLITQFFQELRERRREEA